MKKYKEAVLMIAIIGLPVFFYLFLRSGKQNFLRLPVYGERVYDEQKKDTVYHTLPDFSLTDQTGKPVTLASLDTNIVVANFFFASCPDVCPRLNTGLAEVVAKTNGMPNLRFLSYSVDPENDSVAVLAEYAKRFHADPARWKFLTGSKKELYDLAMQGYLVPVTEEDTTIDHTQNLILIDPSRRIRGYYNGMDQQERNKLIDEIKVLQVELHEQNAHEHP